MNNNYIEAKQFLEQSEKVQKAFIEWWEPKAFDIFNLTVQCEYGEQSKDLVITTSDIEKYGIGFFTDGMDGGAIPLLQMHQLVAFIEDKTKGKIDIINYVYGIEITIRIKTKYKLFTNLGFDLLQALFQVACKIVEGE